MESVILSALLWIAAAISYSVISVLHFRLETSIFVGKQWFDQWVDPKKSYYRKYKYPTPAPSNWYYRILGVKYKEKFFGSTWIFVSLTDGFHAFQHLMLLCLIGAYVSLPNYINTWKDYAYAAIVLHLMWTITHQIFYRWMFIQKRYWH